MVISCPNAFAATSRLVFDQIAGYHGLAKLTPKSGHPSILDVLLKLFCLQKTLPPTLEFTPEPRQFSGMLRLLPTFLAGMSSLSCGNVWLVVRGMEQRRREKQIQRSLEQWFSTGEACERCLWKFIQLEMLRGPSLSFLTHSHVPFLDDAAPLEAGYICTEKAWGSGTERSN